MKKLVFILVALFLIIGVTSTVFANGNHYHCKKNCWEPTISLSIEPSGELSVTPTDVPTDTPTNTPTATPTPLCGDVITLGDKEAEFIPAPCDTPTPTPTEAITPTPTGSGVSDGGSSNADATKAPVCSDGTVLSLPANPHVIRNGTDATVNFFITEGDSANIYVRFTGQSDWNNAITSAIDVKPNGDNFVSYTFHNLDANQGYDFGIQQKQGCGGGQLVTAVVVDGATYHPVLFRFNYWVWSK